MTIIKNTYSIRHHPLTAIDENVADLVIKGAAEHQLICGVANYAIRPPLQILEAYCDITGQRISMDTLKTPAIERVLRGFTAAMAGKEFVELKGDLSKVHCRHLFQALAMAQTHLPAPASLSGNPQCSLQVRPNVPRWQQLATFTSGIGRGGRFSGRDIPASIFDWHNWSSLMSRILLKRYIVP
jgi:hypothetical protein